MRPHRSILYDDRMNGRLSQEVRVCIKEISNPMDYHVALYIRLSKEDEAKDHRRSVTNQKSLLDEFVQKHRLQVYDTYIDDGWSGTNFDRPGFSANDRRY